MSTDQQSSSTANLVHSTIYLDKHAWYVQSGALVKEEINERRKVTATQASKWPWGWLFHDVYSFATGLLGPQATSEAQIFQPQNWLDKLHENAVEFLQASSRDRALSFKGLDWESEGENWGDTGEMILSTAVSQRDIETSVFIVSSRAWEPIMTRFSEIAAGTKSFSDPLHISFPESTDVPAYVTLRQKGTFRTYALDRKLHPTERDSETVFLWEVHPNKVVKRHLDPRNPHAGLN